MRVLIAVLFSIAIAACAQSGVKYSYDDGSLNRDLQQNWRVGGTLAFPIDLPTSIKLYASRGVSARIGNNFDLGGIAWQYRWGGL
jgi:hypothetical protein